ncbi:MAG: hypothetical protein LBV71_07055 [Prevotella sp.]|jgi:hypothetical protein|nr:hypothetical protein [Prevotella sp.]
MNERDIQAIINRYNKATEGNWIAYVEGRDHTSGSSFIMTIDKNGERGNDLEIIGATEADFDFIAHAKQDIPLLIEEVKRLSNLINENSN